MVCGVSYTAPISADCLLLLTIRFYEVITGPVVKTTVVLSPLPSASRMDSTDVSLGAFLWLIYELN